MTLRGFWGKALAMTYSRMRMHTTIGAAAFHFRVRNGIGWFHSAMVTRERVEGRGPVDWLARAHALVGLPPNKPEYGLPSANKLGRSE